MQSLSPEAKKQPTTIVGTLVKMVRQEGILRPIRGLPSMVFGAGPAHAVYFSSYEFSKELLLRFFHSSKYNALAYGVAGGVATVIHDAVMNPAEVVKQRMQMYGSPYKSVIHCIKKTYLNEGLRAFYRSYTTQLVMNIPFQSIHFMVYEFTQSIMNEERKYNPPAHVVSGAMAGAVAAAITTPLDVCKTLLNTQQDGKVHDMFGAVKTVYRLGGSKGFFRGIQARIMFVMPGTAICWSTYEFFKYILGATPHEGPILTVASEDDPPLNIKEPPAKPDNIHLSTEKINLLPRELPAISGGNLYGSISYNTMHTADTSFNTRRGDNVMISVTPQVS
ncbi:mitoferrin-1 isoform X2 [Agrilus planipennis]|nr:mitoferrin-1 isoform X2 [Agrilus planipennis]